MKKIVKELKDIDNIIYHYIEMDGNSECTSKLINIANTVDYFLSEYSKRLTSDFNWREAVKDYFFLRKFIFFLSMYKMVNITKKTLGNNDIERIVDSVNALWLNEKKYRTRIRP